MSRSGEKRASRDSSGFTRRHFLKTGAAAGAAALTIGLRPSSVYGADAIKIGLVGCGSRGLAAVRDCMRAASGVEVVAIADAFADNLATVGEALNVPAGRRFAGLDAHKELLQQPDVNLVMLASPPAFRPAQFAAAVEAGKNIYMEPPVAICPAGYKMVLEAAGTATEKKLSVVVGLQRRHDPATVETMKRIADGAIGRIVTGQCYTNQGGLYSVPRRIGQTNMDHQLRNWRYYRWLSGDIIVERHIHNLDVINWALGAVPERVHGLGGQQYRVSGEYGNVYDHFGTEMFYPNDVHVIGMCRQIEGADIRIGEQVVGTKGSSDCRGTIRGENAWTYTGPAGNAFVQTQADLVKSIRSGEPVNEAPSAAESTFAAILARESAYTRTNFKKSWFLSKITLNLLPPDGLSVTDIRHVEPVAVPGKYVLPGAPTKRR